MRQAISDYLIQKGDMNGTIDELLAALSSMTNVHIMEMKPHREQQLKNTKDESTVTVKKEKNELKEEGIPHFREIRQFTFSDGRFVHVRLFCSPKAHTVNNAQIITVDLDPDVDGIEFIPDVPDKKKGKRKRTASKSKPGITTISTKPTASSSSSSSSSPSSSSAISSASSSPPTAPPT